MNAILIQLISGLSGKASSMRAALIYAVFVSFTVWGYVAVKTTTLPDFPEYVFLTVTALVVGKGWQRGKEEKPDANTTSSLLTGTTSRKVWEEEKPTQ